MPRADLHVHSWHSTESGDLRFLKSRDCYSDPEAVYRTAKSRGMDYVCITDHDSIDGGLALLDKGYPDVILAEEVSCRLPGSGIEVHFGVYGTSEALHRELQPLRGNAFEVAQCLAARDVFFSLNHLLHFYRRQVPLDEYLKLLAVTPALEVRNGAMVAAHNELIERVAATAAPRTLAMTAGSDAHTLRRVGATWTEAPGETPEAYLASVRAGAGRPGGSHGTALGVAYDAYCVIGRFMASLVGIGPQNHAPAHRAFCVLFSLGSLPFQFLPVVMLARAKRHEVAITRETAEYFERFAASGSAPWAPPELAVD
jgi:predicted metal-dependent phosphoesterase TrpH